MTAGRSQQSCVRGEKDAVDEKGAPKLQSVDSSTIIPVLAAALQAEVTRRVALEERLAAIEKRLEGSAAA